MEAGGGRAAAARAVGSQGKSLLALLFLFFFNHMSQLFLFMLSVFNSKFAS